MNLNATLFGQMITFALFVWITMRFVWPPLHTAMADRQKKIADGLAAAEKGHKDLVLSQERSLAVLTESKEKGMVIVDDAHKRAAAIIEHAKAQAEEEVARLMQKAEQEVSTLIMQAKESLRSEVAKIAVFGAEKILKQEIDVHKHERLLQELVDGLTN